MIFLQDGPLPVTLPETKPLTRDNFLSGRHISVAMLVSGRVLWGYNTKRVSDLAFFSWLTSSDLKVF